jgi:hypothetical protein
MKIWLSMQVIKVSIMRLLFTYGISFWIFHIGKIVNNNSKAFDVFSNVIFAVIILCMILIFYSVFEMGYLLGNQFCTELLIMINPLLYEPQTVYGWWPPLLWVNQLRSLFPEPSYFGIVSVLIVPILFYRILKSNTLILSIICGMFLTMVFMTQSRTTVLLFLVQVIFILLYTFLLNQAYLRQGLKIVFICILSFSFSVYMISGFESSLRNTSYTINENNQFAVSDYVSNNITSVIGNKRSNSARYASARATFLTGLEHPFFGVGILASKYISDHFTQEDLNNYEIKYSWLYHLDHEGPLRVALPILNHFLNEMAQFGIPGLIIYLLPVLYIIFELLKRFKQKINLEIACIAIAYIGSIGSFFSSAAFLPYYVLTGLILVLLQTKEGEFEL